MHLIATIPGGWNPSDEGVIYVEQSPGDIVFLSAGDTELYLLSKVYTDLHQELSQEHDVPVLRLANLLWLKQEYTIDSYADDVLSHAKVIVANLLGGKNYYPYLVDVLLQLAEEKGVKVTFLPGNTSDTSVMQHSTVNPAFANRLWKQFRTGSDAHYKNGLQLLLNEFFDFNFSIPELPLIPNMFAYSHSKGILTEKGNSASKVMILAYRTHYLSGNLEPLHELQKSLSAIEIQSTIFFIDNLRDPYVIRELEDLIQEFGGDNFRVCINTTSFSLKGISAESEESFLFEKLGIPVIQAIFASINHESWEEGMFGLSPTDIAINVALPEVDGRIITRPISFKQTCEKDSLTDSDVSYYKAFLQGIDFVTEQTRRWINLYEKENKNKRIAIILPNYPSKDSRIANGVGLDTPASAVEVLAALKDAGYDLGESIPQSTAELINILTENITNDPDSVYVRENKIKYNESSFQKDINSFPTQLIDTIKEKWGAVSNDPFFEQGAFSINGQILENIYIGIQPSRGYNLDPKSIYHSPDLPPTWSYLAFYAWVQDAFKADAIIHLGKHGNLEWLPGKSIALDDETCFPAAIFKPIPNFYPFIINDPGEGTQAKRRISSIIIDHLVPPMTRAESYGSYTSLEHLIDEYYEAFNIDPKRTELIKEKIEQLVQENHLDEDFSYEDIDELLLKLDAYLCELKEAQIRGGLHILGKKLVDEKLMDMLIALHRLPQAGKPGITQALAKDLNLDFNPVDCQYESLCDFTINDEHCRTFGKAIEQLEILSGTLLEKYLYNDELDAKYPQTNNLLAFIKSKTLALLNRTDEELTNLLAGLEGKYIPSGPSGAPTRGRSDILPTGRNFYSVDVRAIPTEVSYELGKKSAQLIINRYLQEEGEYPESIGISVWGTSTMRTGGDDISQAFALIGVEPVWQGANRRIIDFNVIPLFELNRPRIDVTLRISGFFRDAFPDIISLFNAVVKKVAKLDEPLEMNPIRKKYLQEKEQWKKEGLEEDLAEKRSLYRVFGSKPGAYGVGIQKLIDEKNWSSQDDIAKVYMNWSEYAYDEKNIGHNAPVELSKRMAGINIVMQNQDNREHDILDSDDYYQFHGGMLSAVKKVSGSEPKAFFGEHSQPENPKVKSLKEELLKVYRSRAVNPKWMERMRKHGYKGAFEMSATLDYMFAYDATTEMVEDFMYQNMAEAYIFDQQNQDFLREVNPWALRDIAERFLEAIQRKMWQADDEVKEKIIELYLKIEE